MSMRMKAQPGTKRSTDAGIERARQPEPDRQQRHRAATAQSTTATAPRSASARTAARGWRRAPAASRISCRAFGAARQQQVGDVRARDQQQQSAAACQMPMNGRRQDRPCRCVNVTTAPWRLALVSGWSRRCVSTIAVSSARACLDDRAVGQPAECREVRVAAVLPIAVGQRDRRPHLGAEREC